MLAIKNSVGLTKENPFSFNSSMKSSGKKKKKLNKHQRKKRQKEAKLNNAERHSKEIDSSSSKKESEQTSNTSEEIHEAKHEAKTDSKFTSQSDAKSVPKLDMDTNGHPPKENGEAPKKDNLVDSKIIKGINFVYPRSFSKKSSISKTFKNNSLTKPVAYIFAKRREIESELTESFGLLDNKSDIDKKESVNDQTIDDILFPNKRQKQIIENEKKTKQKKTESSSSKTDKIEQNDSKHLSLKADEVKDPQKSKVKNGNKKKSKSETVDVQIQSGQSLSQQEKQNLKTASRKDTENSESRQPNKRKRSLSEDFDANAGNQQLSGLTVQDAVNDKFGRRPRSNSTDGELNLPRRGLCDERMVLESHKWDLEKFYGKKNDKRPRGFVNLGNTCFLNATIQCLTYLPTFCQCVAMVSIDSIKANSKVSNGKRMTLALRSLVRKAHGLDNADGKSNPIAPKEIVRAVPSLGGSSRGYKFRPGRQEDAHEFLVHLLDAMNDGELKGAGINQNKSGWRDRLPIPRLDETTFIHRMFGGYLRSQVHCTTCGHNSNTYDPFLDLSLEVSKKSCTSISAAFADFTRKETLDTENKYKCSGCKKRVCATKQLTVFRPPLTLCIQLKRFTFGSGSVGGLIHSRGGWGYGHFAGKGMNMRGGGKIQKPIDFPETLKLPLSDGRKCAYDLTGLIIHVGGSATSGHYTAYVKKPGSSSGNSWFHMDDSFVETVSTKSVLRQKDAYVLFYCRKEVKLELPNPPPRVSMTAEEARNVSKARAKAKANLIVDNKSQVDKSITQTNASTDSNKQYNKSNNKEDSPTKSALTPPGHEDSEIRDLLSKGGESSSDSSTSSSDESSRSSNSDVSNSSPPPQCLKTVKKSLDSVMAKTITEKANRNNLNKNTKTDVNRITSAGNGSKTSKKLQKAKKMLTVDRGLVKGSVQVVIGKRKKSKSWQPIVSKHGNDAGDLLGNKKVDKWDEEESSPLEMDTSSLLRKKLNEELKTSERKRKRKMHLDSWDAKLDEGKKKKVKSKDDSKKTNESKSKLNLFQHIQTKKQREKQIRR